VTPQEELLGLAGDVDRLLAAGVSAAGGETLRRRGKTLRELGKKVPALVPVADAVERVTGGGKAPPAFLDLLVMSRQLRGSLASAGVDGPQASLPESGPWRTPVAVRELLPVYEALTQSGSGREERVKDAADRGLFGDLRLATALLAAPDGYAAVADAVAGHGLPALGGAVLDELRASVRLDGKAGDARRLRAVCRIDPKAGAALCRQALAGGSPVLRVEALTRLPEVAAGEAEESGLKYHKDKSGDVRAAALLALAAGESDEALSALFDGMEDLEYEARRAAEESLATTRHPRASARLLSELQRLLAVLEEPAPKEETAKTKGTKKAPAEKPPERNTVRARAGSVAEVLGRRKDGDLRAAARAILPLLLDKEWRRHTEPATALHSLGPVTPEILPVLVDLLKSKDSYLASKAVHILDGFPPAAWEAAVPALVDYIESLVREDPPKLKAFSLLCKQAKRHRDEVFRGTRAVFRYRHLYKFDGLGTVLTELEKLGPLAMPVLPDILDAFRSPAQKDVRSPQEGKGALARIDPAGKVAIPELIGMLEGSRGTTKSIALTVLGPYGPKARQAIPAIERLAAGKDQFLAIDAEFALKAIRGEPE
jgi:hypothetical protein